MLSYPHSPGHHMTFCHCHSFNPAIIVTINALGKSDGIQNLKITDLCGHLLFDSTDPTLLAGVDDDVDDDTSLAGVQGNDTSLAGVPIPATTIMTNDDDNNLDTESDHNSIDPNKANKSSRKASVYSTGSYAPVHSTTSEPPQHPPDEDEPDRFSNMHLGNTTKIAVQVLALNFVLLALLWTFSLNYELIIYFCFCSFFQLYELNIFELL